MESMTLTAVEVKELKQASTAEEVLAVVRKRWSPRAFADREVSQADLRKIFEAARWAPSSFNEQPWRFIVGLSGTETHKKIVSALGGFNQAWAPKAPVLILGVARKSFSHNDSPNGYAFFDLGAATGFVTLQAAELGIATHQMAGFDQGIARRELGIPDTFDIGSVMALGYQGEPSTLGNERLQAQELSPRARRPLSEIVLRAWDEPLELG
jgi:nitroreductase